MTDYRTVLHGDTFHRSTMFDANMNIKYSDMINLFFASLTASHHKYSDDTAPKYSIKRELLYQGLPAYNIGKHLVQHQADPVQIYRGKDSEHRPFRRIDKHKF